MNQMQNPPLAHTHPYPELLALPSCINCFQTTEESEFLFGCHLYNRYLALTKVFYREGTTNYILSKTQQETSIGKLAPYIASIDQNL